jgi:uncharacterized damage-inducible protein DinB
MKYFAIAALTLAFASAIVAQTSAPAATSSNPVVSTVRQIEERQSKNLIGAAEAMPADKYSYHPTADQMSFAHLIMHTVEANNGSCARVAGDQPREMKLSENDSKDMLTRVLKDSFAYCEQVLAKADDAGLGTAISLPNGHTTTRAAALIYLVSGWADHYATASNYLRLNGLTPPSAQKTPAAH